MEALRKLFNSFHPINGEILWRDVAAAIHRPEDVAHDTMELHVLSVVLDLERARSATFEQFSSAILG
jgi:hypothetical protein